MECTEREVLGNGAHGSGTAPPARVVHPPAGGGLCGSFVCGPPSCAHDLPQACYDGPGAAAAARWWAAPADQRRWALSLPGSSSWRCAHGCGARWDAGTLDRLQTAVAGGPAADAAGLPLALDWLPGRWNVWTAPLPAGCIGVASAAFVGSPSLLPRCLPTTAAEWASVSLLALFSFVTGSYPAMLHAPRSDVSLVHVAGAVAAAAMSVAYMTLWQAAGKPALQALAGAIMLASSLASSAAWPYSAWCSALAAVPLLLAGKQHAPAVMAPRGLHAAPGAAASRMRTNDCRTVVQVLCVSATTALLPPCR